MAAGYSTNPLYKKLGIKEGATALFIDPPVNYNDLIGGIADTLIIAKKTANDIDFIHFFTNSQKELTTILPRLMRQIKKDGTIWVSWYKKSSGKPTELNENFIRDTALSIGLVDVKVCAVDEDWSGLKLVFRLKDR